MHLYSHRLQVSPPAIHLVVTGERSSLHERKRIMSRPGCRIEQRPQGGSCCSTCRLLPTEKRRELSADDVAFRAFELLLGVE